MEESVLTSVVLPLALFIIMLGVGLSLVVDDFKRVVLYPKAVAVGLVNQLVLLPLVAFGLAHLFQLDPVMAVGLMLIACCPGGVTSNLITFVSRGDAALSVTLTAISGVIVVVTIPLILIFSMNTFMGEAQQFSVPLLDTILQIVAITVVPISLGMLVRRFKPAFAAKMERPARIGSTVIFVAILGGVVAANIEVIKVHFLELSVVTGTLNILMMSLGYASARLLQLKAPQAVAISIETGIQNGTLAIVIATSILERGDLAVIPGVYSLIMFGTGAVVMYYFGVLKKPSEINGAAVASTALSDS
ncbi:bile acid:sodium symporter family protein [Bradymonas sediminis]|uniref:Bile acid:sodium symporter family protein n=1 Tax=Bradymonas sediminis TaxID=1548548 RepID=A0A2Z4FNL6_9DELT|nr:bile acid:sodium symporter family protein [Bradymonas sediminis]AWV90533.1 bile acid:sodium symporter family protein [Bradymonas sediminis]TDP72074.1 BASS family bile acid:Na+ symporter [Bradymonas sediminis]